MSKILNTLSRAEQVLLIRERIDSIKYSKKRIRVNFKYSLNLNNLNHLQQGSGQVGVGGGILEKENKNSFSSYQPDLVRNKEMAPHFSIFLIVPFDFSNEIHGCKRRNL